MQKISKDSDQIDTELNRLRELVEEAYHEGWNNGYEFEKSASENN